MFHYSTTSVPLFHHDCSTVPLSDVPLFHHQMFYSSIIRCSTVPLFHDFCLSVPPSDVLQFHHQMVHCSIISVLLFHHLCSTVPPSYVLLFYHLYSTVALSAVPLFQYQMLYCSTVAPSDVLVFHHLCSTVLPRVFYCSTIRCLTLPPCLFLCSIMTSGTSSAFVKPQWHFVYSPSLGLAWQNLTKQARYFWFHTTFSFSKEIKRYLLSEQYSTVTWIEILLKPYLNYACSIFPLS